MAGQTVVQPPHVAGFVMSVSHPSLTLAEQCIQPAAHDDAGTEHAPATHDTGPLTFFRAVQSWPHAPQFFASVCVLVHAPAHDVFAAGGQEHPPPPIVHTWPLEQAAQAAPFVPQLLPVCAAVTQPVPSQQPLAHDVALHATHAPAEQIEPLPHDLPSLMFAGDAHVGPPVQVIVPCWQGLPGGEQAALGVQAAHVPWPSHTPLGTPLAWHEVPAGAAAF